MVEMIRVPTGNAYLRSVGSAWQYFYGRDREAKSLGQQIERGSRGESDT
jgi:hypothetical protein